MYLPGCLYRNLTELSDDDWQHLVDRHRFWERPAFTLDEEHRDIAFHILMTEGRLANSSTTRQQVSGHEFDAVSIPDKHFDDRDFVDKVQGWSNMHGHNYGAGVTTKMGWYTIHSGGFLGYHVDGPIFLRGTRADLAANDIQRSIVDLHASHRTILPLRFNPGDEFLICGQSVPLKRGQMFEFSNVLPHAYKNSGPSSAVLLVTTYLVDELLPRELTYAC